MKLIILCETISILLLFCANWRRHMTSVQFSPSVLSDSLRPHGLQHARLPCSSATPRAYSNSCPSSLWCHPTISSSVILFSSHLQFFQASGSFPMSQFFASGGQSIGVSASTSLPPVNTQDWLPLGWASWISLQSKGLSESYSTSQFRSINSLVLSLLYGLTLTSIQNCWKNHNFDYMNFCRQSDISALQYAIQVCPSFSSKEQWL